VEFLSLSGMPKIGRGSGEDRSVDELVAGLGNEARGRGRRGCSRAAGLIDLW